MRPFYLSSAALLCVLFSTAVAVAAGSNVRRAPPPAQVYGHYGDQRGCYWAEGRRRCSRYCYWDFDGGRYCQDRERLAFPQADPWFVPYPPEPPIYPRYRRLR